MAKWADYLVSAVRFDVHGNHIDWLRVHVDNGDTVGPGNTYSRPDVVAAIKRGVTFMTITAGSGGTWNQGQRIYVVPIGGSEFLETYADSTRLDNLDNLPRF